MPVYTVHEPPRKEDDRDDDASRIGARFVFVRDGFHFWAFLLAPLWMLRHRMWLELIAYLLLIAGITFGLQSLGVAESAGFAVGLLLSLLVGMEASSLRRWKLSRRGFASVGVVVGDDLEDAERRFFDGWTARERPTARDASAAAVAFLGRPRPRSSGCSRNRKRGRDRRDRRLRLGQPALGGESVRARGARVRLGSADPGHRRPGDRAQGGPRGAARRRRLRGLPPRAPRGPRHGRGAERDGAQERPAVPRHLRRHAADGRARARIRGGRGPRLDPGRGRPHHAGRRRA